MNAQQQQHRSRKNGLDRPWGYAQMGAWMTYSISVVQYCIFITPLLSPCITSPILSLLFFLSNIYVFYYASATILINPIDIHLQQYRCIHEAQQQQNDDANNDNETNNRGMSNGGKTNNAAICKPVIIRNPLHQPPMMMTKTAMTVVPNNRHHRTNATKQRTVSTSTSTAKPSLGDRLYYRTNAKQLQLYNSSSHHAYCRNNHNNSYSSPQSQFQQLPHEPMKQCWICDTSVAEHSMHCKFCNKCVYGFDHHCIWLNTCIGRANYESFFRTLQSLFVMEVIHFISHLILIIVFFQSNDELKARIHDTYRNISIYAPLAIWIFFMIFNCVALILLGQLYVFHTLLQVRNLTTYEHIVQEYRSQRNLTRRMNELEAERSESIIRAKSQKETIKVMRLQLGGFFRAHGLPWLDVLKLPPDPPEPDPEAGFANIFGGGGGGGGAADSGDSGDNNYNDDRQLYNNSNYVNDVDHDGIEIMDTSNNNCDSNHDRETNDDNNEGENNADDHDNDNNNSGGIYGKITAYDVDQSLHSNRTNKSIRTSTSKQENELHDIMYDGGDGTEQQQQQSPPNYVELTMSGQNDYNYKSGGEVNDTVVIDDGGGDDYDNDNNHDSTNAYNDDILDTTAQPQNDADDHDDDDDNEVGVDGLFIDDPDDMSHKSGCSGRSYRSGRSGRSSKSGRKLTSGGERDLTAF